jgi:hypothetical protein
VIQYWCTAHIPLFIKIKIKFLKKVRRDVMEERRRTNAILVEVQIGSSHVNKRRRLSHIQNSVEVKLMRVMRGRQINELDEEVNLREKMEQ